MKLLKSQNIAIIGGGPGGLTLARLLQMNGINVKVYERDEHKDARAKGATLDLHEDSGLLALKEAGLMSDFMANYRPDADKMMVMDHNANIVYSDHANDNHDASRPEIDRGPLQHILMASLNPGTIIWDSQFTDMTPEAGGWKLNLRNGNSAFADIVIAADGANSKLRSYITPIKPFFAGVTIVEGAVNNASVVSPCTYDLIKGGKIFALGKSQTLVISAKGDESLNFYVGFQTDEQWVKDCEIDFSNKKAVIAWFKQEFSEWDTSWLELFENASSFTLRPQYCMPLDQTWVSLPNLTILGDAAHLMPPYAGEGVNMAMLDALELSRCLLSQTYPDTRTAIEAYEVNMRIRASETAKDTLLNTHALHAPGAIDFMTGLVGGGN